MQIKILSITDEGAKIKLHLLIEKKDKRYKKIIEITPEAYDRIGSPSENTLLSELHYKSLQKEKRKNGVNADAVNILSYGDNNRKNLQRKLVAKGHTPESAKEAVEGMVNLGYLNEFDQAYRYVITLANNKKYGPRKIFPYLRSRGYASEDINGALKKAVENGEINFPRIKQSLILKYHPENDEKEKKLLFKHGFYSSNSDE